MSTQGHVVRRLAAVLGDRDADEEDLRLWRWGGPAGEGTFGADSVRARAVDAAPVEVFIAQVVLRLQEGQKGGAALSASGAAGVIE